MNQDLKDRLDGILSRDYSNTAGILVQKDGKTCLERYNNGFTHSDAAHVFSVTKSVVSALIGIALDQGYLKGVDQRVLDFFPDYPVPDGERHIQAVTLEHLLTMTAPYKCETEPYEAFFTSQSWVRFALDLLGGRPAGQFVYSPIIGAHILSGVLASATRQPVLEFARKNLFSPLGIQVTRNVTIDSAEEQMAFYTQRKHAGSWVVDPQGLNTASWGLTLTVRDMAKLGKLYLNRGQWAGRQVLPADWVQASTREHAQWNGLSYGYLWWVIGQGVFAAMGDGGNVIYVNANKRLVVAMAALFAPEAKDRLDLIQEWIEPAFEG